MAVTKRTRYEVLARDNNTCRYCRSTENALTIDHVIPTALGGSDNPDNLVAACKDCNAGKSSSNPDAALVAQVSDDAVRWSAAMQTAAERLASHKAEVDEHLKPWFGEWELHARSSWAYKLPSDADDVLRQYLAAGMPIGVLVDAARISLRKSGRDNYFRYFRGVANNMLAELQADAQAILTAGGDHPKVDESNDDATFGWDNRAWRKGYMTALSHIERFESGDPTYWEAPPISAFQYRSLAMVVDAEAVNWVASS